MKNELTQSQPVVSRCHTLAKSTIVESQPNAVEPFIGHVLPHSYWTEDVLCCHDVTFTKHKKYTFCSAYKTASEYNRVAVCPYSDFINIYCIYMCEWNYSG